MKRFGIGGRAVRGKRFILGGPVERFSGELKGERFDWKKERSASVVLESSLAPARIFIQIQRRKRFELGRKIFQRPKKREVLQLEKVVLNEVLPSVPARRKRFVLAQ